MIYLPKHYGLCNGLKKMLNTIYEIYENEIENDNSKNIYIYKKFINNDTVIKEIEDLGIKIINNLNELSSDDILIIGPLGISNEEFNILKEKKIKYYDVTCSKISKLKNNILNYLDKDYLILLINNIDNLNLTNKNIYSIKDEKDIDKLPKDHKVYIVNLLIEDNELFLKLQNILKTKYKKVIIDDFTCLNYKQIIDSNLSLTKDVKNIFWIGDNNLGYKSFHNLKEFRDFILENDYKLEDDYGLISFKNVTSKELLNYKYYLSFLLFYKSIVGELKENQNKINTSMVDREDNLIIKEVINKFSELNQNGKYLRGVFIALGEYIASNKNNLYLNLASAYETFETAILIHDDIIDNAKMRRGKMTIPREICYKYLKKNNSQTLNNDTIRLANSIGICAGDYGIFMTNKIICDYYGNHPLFYKIVNTYNDIVIKTIRGEILDVYLPYLVKYKYQDITENEVIEISHLKTSWYTFIGPFTLGYLLGGKELTKEFEKVLDLIGVYFQIKDDLLGIFGDEKITGKSVVSDIKEFKQTLLYTYIINTDYKNEFLKIYGNQIITKKKFAKIKKLLIDSGSLKYCENYLEDLYYNILDNIDNLDLEENYKDILKGLLLFLKMREK